MQRIARDGLTATQVRAVVEAPNVEVDFGVDLLDSDDSFIEEITGADVDGEVDSNNFRSIHRLLSLTLPDDINWGRERLRPWMTLAAGDHSFRANLGVYLPSTPQRAAGRVPLIHHVEGYDKTVVLDTPIGRTFRAVAGDGYLQTARDLILETGETRVLVADLGDDSPIPADRLWPIDEANTYRKVVNELVAAAGGRAVWADWNGRLVLDRYQSAKVRAPEWVFNTSHPTTTVGEDRTETVDDFEVPNQWVFIRDDPELGPPATDDGVYVVDNIDEGPTSQAARAGRIVRRVVPLQAANQAALIARGDQVAAQDRQVYRYLDLNLSPLPLLWHFDVVEIVDAELSVSGKWQGWTWNLPLNGDDVTSTWRSIL